MSVARQQDELVGSARPGDIAARRRLLLLRARVAQIAVELRRAVLRSGRDRRARRILLTLLLLLGLLIFEAGYLLRTEGATPLFLLLAIPGGILTWVLRRRSRRDPPVTLGLSAPEPVASDLLANAEQRQQMAHDALRLAALLERAHGELFLRGRVLKENEEVILRRRVLAVAQRLDLLPRMPPRERELLTAPDGAWSDDQIAATLVLQEGLRVLQWVLGDLPLLPSLADAYQLDVRVSAAALEGADALLVDAASPTPAHPGQPVHVLREEARLALGYYARCLGEQLRRGDAEMEETELRSDLLDLAGQMRGESTDLLLGSGTVGSSGDGELRLAAVQSWRRWQTLETVAAWLETGERAALERMLVAEPGQETQ